MVSLKALCSVILAPITVFLMGTSTPLYAQDGGAKIAGQGAAHPGAVACVSCHAADGGGNEEAGFPRLAGVNATYLERQLRAYKDGSNKNPVMSGMASSLTDQEITEVAGYYASLQPVSHAKAPSGVPVEPGKHLAGYGDMPARGLPACVQCHGPGGLGRRRLDRDGHYSLRWQGNRINILSSSSRPGNLESVAEIRWG